MAKKEESARITLETVSIGVKLEGIADIMFDRFYDHSKDVRPPEQKVYLNQDSELVLPSENVMGFLFNENPPGCIKLFEGKKSKQYLWTGQSHIMVEPMQIPFKRDGKAIKVTKNSIDIRKPNDLFYIEEFAPRTKMGGGGSIKQEMKHRPVLRLPWSLGFTITLVRNEIIDVNKLHNWFDRGGIMVALGTFRPRFGRFTVAEFKEL